MFFDDHYPPHIHVEYSGQNAIFDFKGNILKGDLNSKTATKLVREWIDLNQSALEEDWLLAVGGKEIKKIDPLD
jgi:hypothetical protein